MGAQSSQDTVVSRIVVEEGLATEQEVSDCRALMEQQGVDAPLAEVLINNGYITRSQFTRMKPKLDEEKPTQQIPGYQILGKLGAGAMATVYLARQLSLDRKVAVKILPKRYLTNEQFVERFYAEGRAAAKLNHPNIVGAVDVGKAGDRHYFVMEFVEGHTVYDDLTEQGRYSEKDALNIVIQIAKALEHAHNAGFIHRDVKPKNIMITGGAVAKLADMGLARAVTDREAAEQEKGRAFGTPYYISPEQIRGLVDVDFRADIYGLGATFYHMVTGQVPFEAPNPSAVMHKHLREEPVAPDQINPELSAGVCEIIEVMMNKDRSKRYNTTTDLIRDLEEVAQGRPPLQARKSFNFTGLIDIENSSEVGANTGGVVSVTPHEEVKPSPAVFIGMLIAVGVAVLELIILIVVLMNR